MKAEELRRHIAEALGWSEADVRSFSLPMLREVVRRKSPKLAAEIDQYLVAGAHVRGES
jgi:hypothetical protein